MAAHCWWGPAGPGSALRPGHLLPMATHLPGPWRRPGARLVRGVAFLAAPALKLVVLGCLPGSAPESATAVPRRLALYAATLTGSAGHPMPAPASRNPSYLAEFVPCAHPFHLGIVQLVSISSLKLKRLPKH